LLDELLSIALIGTARSGQAGASLPSSLQDAAICIADPSPEQRLLTQTILLCAFLRAGLLPTIKNPARAAAQPDLLSPCSVRAADLLADLLRRNQRELIGEWLAGAASARRRIPHRLLPDLLDLARRDKTLRESVAAVIDHRGRWMMSENPDWQFSAGNEALDEQLWEVGTPEQRVIVLRQTRQADPARSRELVAKTWKSDSADERAEFLKLFATNLSLADEPFLESLLDDRSKEVRAIAADLLGRLPQSQLVQRMIQRVLPRLNFKKGLVRGTRLDVTLPIDLDKSAQRDGVEQIAPQGIGEKQWWLQQMLSFVPLSVWQNASELLPADIIAASAKTDFADILLKGFSDAGERHSDPIWLDPLLRHGLEKTGRLNRVLLAALPAPQFLGLAVDVLRHKRVSLVACGDLINNHNVPLDLAAARLLVNTVAELAGRADRAESTVLYQLPPRCAMRVPPEVRPDIEALWTGDKEPWAPHRSQVEKLLNALEIRQQIQKEFSS
jgi:hypothetical protein